MEVTYDAPSSCWRPLMSQELRAAAVLVVSEESSPPPQPAKTAAPIRIRSASRFKIAPVYLRAPLGCVCAVDEGGRIAATYEQGVCLEADRSSHRRGRSDGRDHGAGQRGVSGGPRRGLLAVRHQRQAAGPRSLLRHLPQGPGCELRQGREGDQGLPPVPPSERRPGGNMQQYPPRLQVQGRQANRRAERAVQRDGEVPQDLERVEAREEPVHAEHLAATRPLKLTNSVIEVPLEGLQHQVRRHRRALLVQVDAVGFADDRLFAVY